MSLIFARLRNMKQCHNRIIKHESLSVKVDDISQFNNIMRLAVVSAEIY
jgi:hypothetical protein